MPNLCNSNGSHSRRISCVVIQPATTPIESPTPTVLTSATIVWLSTSPWPTSMTASNTSTAKRAPIGSITMPSHRNIRSISCVGRIELSKGAITVGPVTTSTAPNTAATRQLSSSNQ